MEKYKNLAGNSPIILFEITETAIEIEYEDGHIYRYSYIQPGKKAVEKMKELAKQGTGLCTYINQFVRKKYEKKIK